MHRIAPSDVEIGMYVTGFDGPWINHPFWRTNFRVSTESQLQKIRHSGVPGVHIRYDEAPPRRSASPPSGLAMEMPRFTLDLRTSATVPAQGSAAEKEFSVSLMQRSKVKVQQAFQKLRMGEELDLVELDPVVREINAAVGKSAIVLHNIMAMKTRAEYTHLHSVAVCGLMVNFARRLGMGEAETERLGMAGLLHDVGKAFIPDAILTKPERLTREEVEIVQSHTVLGHAAVTRVDSVPEDVPDVVLNHHERFDGTGYPNAVPPGQISTAARMGAICDVYDAVTSDRSYKDAWSPQRGILEMSLWPGHFDLELLKVFMKTIAIYPVGSRLRLIGGEEVLVVGESPNPVILSAQVFGRERYNANGALIVENVRAEDVTEVIALGD